MNYPRTCDGGGIPDPNNRVILAEPRGDNVFYRRCDGNYRNAQGMVVRR